MRAIACVIAGVAWGALAALAQRNPSTEIADRVIEQENGAGAATMWTGNRTGLQVEGMAGAWYNSADGRYFQFIRRAMDAWLEGKREATGSDADDLAGRGLLVMYRVTQEEKYYRAAEALDKDLEARCGPGSSATPGREEEVGDSCRAEAFLAEFQSLFHPGEPLDGITREFENWNRAGTRGDGARLAASLVDAVPFYGQGDAGRLRLLAILRRIARDATAGQDEGSGWIYGAPRGRQPLSREETSLLVYALAKGVRLGYLSPAYERVAGRAWSALAAGDGAAGSGGDGALLLAATEMDLAGGQGTARGMTVLVDSWFNSQQRRNAAGGTEYFHYKWDDFSDSGYSLLGHIWRSHGARTETLAAAPDKAGLAAADFYFIVSPDIPVKNPHPHYMTNADAEAIAAWVRDGGVLALMENDPPNADIEHMNLLSDRFGIHFDNVLRHHILGEQVADGRIPVLGGEPLFRQAHTLYMKDTCAISLSGPATALLRDRGDVVMAQARYGRGLVFATVDPWLYNEYTDGRKKAELYGQFDNFAAGKEFVAWLIQQRARSGAPRKQSAGR